MSPRKRARKKLYHRMGELAATSTPEELGKLAEAYAKVTYGAYGVQEQNVTHADRPRKGVGFE